VLALISDPYDYVSMKVRNMVLSSYLVLITGLVSGLCSAQDEDTASSEAAPDPSSVAPSIKSGDVKLQAAYDIVKFNKPVFKEGVTLLAKEQDEFAEHLTKFALTNVVDNEGAKTSIELAEKCLSVALHLSPRNREAVVANFQLSKGLLPKSIKRGFSGKALSSLLSVRANQLLELENATPKDIMLAGCFATIASEMNPQNEDAVYVFQIHEVDHGKIDWGQFHEDKK